MAEDSSHPRICILGTGEFARALGARFRRYGVPFWFGSRDPARRPTGLLKEVIEKSTVKNVEEACTESDIIILAIHRRHYGLLERCETHLDDKILVDVSNEPGSELGFERLATMFPKCAITKAFNTASSRAMALDEGPCVYVCGNDEAARRVLLRMAARIGLPAVDYGRLGNGGALEEQVNRLFPGWGWPCLVVMVISAFWIVFAACRAFKLRKNPYSPERLPTNVANKIVGAIAATCLGMAYFPGCLVAFVQLARGSKNVDLPKIIDQWLGIRQQLGLFALILATLHVILSLVLISPAYFPHWYPEAIDGKRFANGTPPDPLGPIRMTWIGETVILLGALAMVALVLIGIATLPAISRSLGWREWRCVQSHMGFACLLLTTCHVVMRGAPVWLNKSVKDVIPTVSFLSLLLPWLTVGMRLVLYTPCLYRRVARIRSGEFSKYADSGSAGKDGIKKETDDGAVGDLSIVV
ncbi:hypothetical protein LSH36_166g01007 [Paralvinella palmiformis]|uniref:Uncharacterized protein n=1 Tax=Paralvinella palmiformis TaxID=53620 RepID=A0AAD9N689_9ANNE|nr:hypothetical protein LSH36_166g01007 [Paralvinella palmiformis]